MQISFKQVEFWANNNSALREKGILMWYYTVISWTFYSSNPLWNPEKMEENV